MKLVFFSADRLEVEEVGRELAQAGIACQVRAGPKTDGVVTRPPQAELWAVRDEDSSKAFLACVQSSIGFGKQKVPPAELQFWNEATHAAVMDLPAQGEGSQTVEPRLERR